MFRRCTEGPVSIIPCIKCGEAFKSGDSFRAPLVLNCAHTECEECVRTSLCNAGKIVCKECGIISVPRFPMDMKFSNLRENFPLSAHIINVISQSEKMKPLHESSIGFKSTKKQKEKEKHEISNSSSLFEGACAECNEVVASYRCEECQVNYCTACFAQNHRSNVLKKHTRIPLNSDSSSESSFQTPEKKVEYIKQLQEVYTKLKLKKIKLENSLKMLNNPEMLNEVKTSNFDWPKLADDLKQFFVYCSNIIQKFERKIMDDLRVKTTSLDTTHAACVDTLNASMMRTTNLISDVYKTLTEDVYDSQIVDLIAKANDLIKVPDSFCTRRPVAPQTINMPTHEWITVLEEQLNLLNFGEAGEIFLYSGPIENEPEGRIDVPLPKVPCSNMMEDGVDVISCTSFTLSERSMDYLNGTNGERRLSRAQSVIQLPTNGEVVFSSGDQLSHSICIPDTKHISSEKGFKIPSNVRQIRVTNLSQCVSSPHSYIYSTNYPATVQNVNRENDAKMYPPRIKTNKQIKFKEGYRMNVIMSNIVTPSCFYVQLKEAIYTMEKYRKFFSRADEFSTLNINDIKIGNLFLAQCKDGEWYRVRILSVVSNSEDEEISIIQIDTGRTEKVPIQRLRRIDAAGKVISMDPELAIQCSLYDCHPVGPIWKKEDTEFFASRLSNKTINMTIMKVQSSKLEVDLFWNENGRSASMREYMILTKMACLASAREHASNISVAKDGKYFIDTDFKKGQWIDVIVTHIDGPDEFYVKRHDSASNNQFSQMLNRIDAFFRCNANYKSLPVYNPPIGLPVAAQYQADNKWYRAEVISTKLSSKKIEVRYVDFGNTEVLTFARIRQLPEEFFRFTTQAKKCTLSEILPVNNRYNMMAIKYFASQVEDKVLKMVVEEVKETVLHVLLYFIHEEKDVCINSLLVKENHARKIGYNLGQALYPKRKILQRPKVESVISPKDEIELFENCSNADQDGSQETSTEEPSQERTETSSEHEHKYEVQIVSMVNPNLFYVTPSQFVRRIQQLNDEMFKFYRDDKNNKDYIIDNVEVDMKCAAYVDSEKKWYRAKVENIDGDAVTVFLKDIARREVVLKSNLRGLTKDFSKLIDGTLECHMDSVEDRDDWPADLCDSLKQQLNKYNKIYITKKDTAENRTSVKVELWGKNVTCPGPFDPFTEEWTNINELLLKTLSSDETSDLPESELDKEYDPPRENLLKKLDCEIGEISSVDTVQEWLQNSIIEATEKGVEYSDIVANGAIPPEHLFSPARRVRSPNTTIFSIDDIEEEPDGEMTDKDWLPAPPLTEAELLATPSYIDNDFNVYVQTEGMQKKTLEVISSGLQSRYRNSRTLPIDLNWYPGQICIALFHLDNKWYRGRVKELLGDKAFVEYVDFGNTEWVEKEKLRKNTTLHNIPIQCHRIPIRSDCVPTTAEKLWPTNVLDFVHGTILEKLCRITLRKEKGEDFYRIEKLVTPENLDVFDLLYQLNHAVCLTKVHNVVPMKSQAKSIIASSQHSPPYPSCQSNDDKSDASSSIAAIESVSNLDMNELLQVPGVAEMIDSPFEIPQNPQNNEIVIPDFRVPPNSNVVTVEIMELLQLDEVVVHILHSDCTAVNDNRTLFEEMTSQLQKKAAEQPILKPPYLGRICSTKFKDDIWYRVKVIGHCTDEKTVPVLYIDYGNSSTASIDSLHQLKRSWFNVPAQAIRCKLIDFELKKDTKDYIAQMVVELLNNQYKALIEVLPESDSYTIKILEDVN